MKRTTELEGQIVEALAHGEVDKAIALRKQLRFLLRLEEDRKLVRCFLAACQVPMPADVMVTCEN